MDPTTANERRDELLLLDVREPDEWNAGHAAAAVHVPMGELGERQDELPTDRAIVCVCRSGGRSAAVTEAPTRAGYDAHNLVGGMLEWRATGLEVVTDDGSEGRVR